LVSFVFQLNTQHTLRGPKRREEEEEREREREEERERERERERESFIRNYSEEEERD
jgi:hypothetical protein